MAHAPNPGTLPPMTLPADAALDRSSFVPLYYQLQEILKQQIESGAFAPGDALPSEPELCRRFGVSRIVVRQALAILEDDHQVERVRGRGTYVAQPKRDHRAGGLVRLLDRPRDAGIAIGVLDVSTPRVEQSIRRRLQTDGEILRVTTKLSIDGTPIAISYSYFERASVDWLEEAITAGRDLPRDLVLRAHGVELAHAELAIETSHCGHFEAAQFGLPDRSAVFLVLATEFRTLPGGGTAPFEVTRAEYRGDVIQFRLDVAGEPGSQLAATVALAS